MSLAIRQLRNPHYKKVTDNVRSWQIVSCSYYALSGNAKSMLSLDDDDDDDATTLNYTASQKSPHFHFFGIPW